MLRGGRGSVLTYRLEIPPSPPSPPSTASPEIVAQSPRNLLSPPPPRLTPPPIAPPSPHHLSPLPCLPIFLPSRLLKCALRKWRQLLKC